MIYLDNHPKNSDTFVCLSLHCKLFGYRQSTKERTEQLYDDLLAAWNAIDDPDTKWIAFKQDKEAKSHG